jgi:hypothetical protein
VDWERHFRPLSDPLQAPQRAYLVGLHRVDTRRAVPRPADVWPAGGQLNLRPERVPHSICSGQFKRRSALCVATIAARVSLELGAQFV